MMDDGWWTPMTAPTKETTDMPMQSDLARWTESVATGRPVPDAPTPTPSQIAKREALLCAGSMLPNVTPPYCGLSSLYDAALRSAHTLTVGLRYTRDFSAKPRLDD
jgi:hypothetical protein